VSSYTGSGTSTELDPVWLGHYELDPFVDGRGFCADPFCLIVKHRRGLLQLGSVVAGGVCIVATWGGCTPLVATLAAANVAQSAQDNLLGDQKCVSNFVVSAAANIVPLGVNRAAASLPGELVDAARSQVGSMGLIASSGLSATNTCGGG